MKIIENLKIKTVVGYLLMFYSLFFVLGSILAPVTAKLGFFGLADSLYNVFSYSCHQQPLRVFWVFGFPMAICARCLGFYLGFIFILCLFVTQKLKTKLIFSTILFVMGFSEIVFETYFGFNSSNIIRMLSGIFLGMSVILFIFSLFTTIYRRICNDYFEKNFCG